MKDKEEIKTLLDVIDGKIIAYLSLRNELKKLELMQEVTKDIKKAKNIIDNSYE